MDQLLPTAPGGAGGTYRFTFPRKLDFAEYMGRIDHSFSQKNRFSVRYFWHDRDEVQIGGLPQFQNWISAPTRNLVAEDIHMFTPAVTNTFRFARTIVEEFGVPL